MGHYTDEEKTALTNLGFEHRDGAYAKTWTEGVERQRQIITIAKLEDGWSFVWQRGYTYTIDERRARTLPLLIEMLWDCIFTRSERYLELIREQATHKVHGRAIYGSVIRVLAQDTFASGVDTSTPSIFHYIMGQGTEQTKALQVALDELGEEVAVEIFEAEWNRLVLAELDKPKERA